jgi:hypothetical protein
MARVTRSPLYSLNIGDTTTFEASKEIPLTRLREQLERTRCHIGSTRGWKFRFRRLGTKIFVTRIDPKQPESVWVRAKPNKEELSNKELIRLVHAGRNLHGAKPPSLEEWCEHNLALLFYKDIP